ncbi:hypothetical protein ACFQ4C_20625 [Larkinella insperata]|uniref:60S ribosomal protein L29 n=1 Tax=Larkinella insperata TaxID=332158 RepID=A0ABW3QA09_9BACT
MENRSTRPAGRSNWANAGLLRKKCKSRQHHKYFNVLNTSFIKFNTEPFRKEYKRFVKNNIGLSEKAGAPGLTKGGEKAKKTG